MGLSKVNVMGGPQSYASAANQGYNNNLEARASGATVVMVKGYNSGPKQWIQLFDAAALPADGQIGVSCLRAGADDNFSFVIPVAGLPPFKNGIVVCNSTTGEFKTIGALVCLFEVYYI